MKPEKWELDPDRLGTTDEYGGRVFLYPAEVRGKFKSRKNWIHGILILVFLAVPWLKINGKQMLLLDIPNRHFEIFGLTFRAHDAPMVFFILAGGALSLFLITAIWGRLWCGWACPQTVFIDGVFRRIEKWTEGSPLERKKADAGPMTGALFFRKILKWTGFTVTSMIVAHSFLAYFVGAERLLGMTTRPPSENFGNFALVMIATGVLLFDFGWFREQFCVIMCPYGRLQSALFDEHTMVVAYDTKRGEPRRGQVAPGETSGDCVNCYRCVQVCPTGIDIRRGTQMECLACTACIDACDEVMTKVKKPTGLIRYDSELGLQGETPQKARFRTILYGILLTAVSGSFVFALTVKTGTPVQAHLLRGRSAPYQVQKMGDGTEMIINHFQVELSNQSNAVHEIRFEVNKELKQAGLELVTPLVPLPIKSGDLTRAELFIRFPKSVLKNGSLPITIRILEQVAGDETKDGSKPVELQREVTLVGPFS